MGGGWVLRVLYSVLVWDLCTRALTAVQNDPHNADLPKDFVNISGVESNDTTKPPIIPVIEGHAEESEEKRSSLAIFFILSVIVAATLVVHTLIISKLYFIPESLAIVILGAFVGLVLSYSERDWSQVESLSPNMFFLVLLPPIIFESGYNLHKGDFFANMFPILSFAILGTTISALTVGSGLYILGQADLIYQISAAESYTFGSLISAVDPVATLAIFQALEVEPMLYMLVFGESMLNDAVAIVLTSTAQDMSQNSSTTETTSTSALLFATFWRFSFVFFVSAVVGAAIGFLSALLFKHIDLRRTPSLEFALLLVFAYLPYGLAEALSLSGIMAILFCSITMSQYTHFNISPVTQITFQQTFRTIAFVAETCTFAYLGMALFTIGLEFHPAFIFWSILLCFIGRALNVFPLALLANKCRYSQISMKNQFIMWFSGLRGAVAFVLALHISVGNEAVKRVLLTTTLVIVLFTIVFLGGCTLPLLKILNIIFTEKKESRRSRRRGQQFRKRKRSPVLLSKTQEMSIFDQSEHLTSAAEDSVVAGYEAQTYSAASRFNEYWVRPLFVRKFTNQELLENRLKLRSITSQVLGVNEAPFLRPASITDEFSDSSLSPDRPLLAA